ncbi:zinc finger RNA-binding protein-like [Rhodamnia argentea]|uniref:Zinc finger RNA-binding protein-like n=1 Tax=Rhodamnia argentea TaxID=178133 RepID=A0A8B8MUR0_9MYRT|nr:zinc finger RNA-binding protein-like [Rhodamnia argentea]
MVQQQASMDCYSTNFAQFRQNSRPPPYLQVTNRSDSLLSLSSSSSPNPPLHLPKLFDPSSSFTFSALPQPQVPHLFYADAGAVATLPGAAPFSSLSSYPAHHVDGTPSYAAYRASSAPSLAATSGNQQYGVDPATYGGVHSPTILAVPTDRTGQLAAINLNPAFRSNPKVKPPKIGAWKKHPKKTKVVQSAYCGTCNVHCNSKDMLDQHKLGKKHMKNLEKLKEAANSVPTGSNGSSNALIGPPENPDQHSGVAEQNSRKKAASEPVEDLETKRRRVVQGGAAVDAVRTCTICNVVCNSDTVFMYHLTGQKHTTMLKKHTAGS